MLLPKIPFGKILASESLILPVEGWSATEQNLRLHRWLQWLGRKIEVWRLLLDLEKLDYYHSLLFLFIFQWVTAAISSPAPLPPASSSSPPPLEPVQRAPLPGGDLCQGWRQMWSWQDWRCLCIPLAPPLGYSWNDIDRTEWGLWPPQHFSVAFTVSYKRCTSLNTSPKPP